jgi:pimeloyl-ACP methyl ester carboxylesterase
VSLHTTDLGDHGSRIVFCHGLFGQGRNWTQVGKALAADHRVTLVDMPHHGRSAWPQDFDYLDVADRVAELLPAHDPVTLVGHSMGGKAAMVLALRHPELVARLCVVDIAPVAYARAGEFRGYVDAMQGLDLATITTRAEADAGLADAVPNPTVRSFLLQNLRRDGDGWRWQANLDVLGRDLSELGGWPEEELAGAPPYDGPTLWVAGATSPYVREEYAPAMEALFPRVRRVTIKGAGHWVHSEQPETFLEVLRRFAG